MKSGSLIVKSHSPVKRQVLIAVALAVVFGGGWTVYFLGQQEAGFDRLAAGEVQGQMEETIRNLEAEKEALRDQLALYERSKQVDKQAYNDVNSTLRALQEEILELREEVTFYRGIVAPVEGSSGLRIERFRVESAGEERLYTYKLVLTQVLKNQRTVRGTVSLSINGIQNGRPRELSLGQVEAGRNRHAFRFRYFQKYEGNMLLPEGFTPRSVTVVLNPSKGKDISRSFDWPANGSAPVMEEAAAEGNAP